MDEAHVAGAVAGGGPFPLVVISHGYPGNRYLMSHLGENLASKGYVTVSIDHAESTYANGTKMVIRNANQDVKMGTKWIGTDGWVWVDRGGFDASKDELKKAVKRRQGDKVIDGFEAPKLGDDIIKRP